MLTPSNSNRDWKLDWFDWLMCGWAVLAVIVVVRLGWRKWNEKMIRAQKSKQSKSGAASKQTVASLFQQEVLHKATYYVAHSGNQDVRTIEEQPNKICWVWFFWLGNRTALCRIVWIPTYSRIKLGCRPAPRLVSVTDHSRANNARGGQYLHTRSQKYVRRGRGGWLTANSISCTYVAR